MSLSNLLESNIDFKTIIKEHLPKKDLFTSTSDCLPAFSTKYEILAPYLLDNSSQAGLVGTTFDYMARFIVAKYINLTDKHFLNNLISYDGVNMLISNLKRLNLDKQTLNKYQSKYDNSINKIDNFLKSSDSKFEELYSSACYLAKAETVFRSGKIPDDHSSLLTTSDIILNDVDRICKVFYNKYILNNLLKKDSIVIFNPHFGDLSIACDGADADIFIDGTLYDFKTSKNLGYSWVDVAQIYSYYLLDCLCKILNNGSEKDNLGENRIERIAFYRARFGIIESLDVKRILKSDLIDTLVKLKNFLYDYNKIYFSYELNISDDKIIDWVNDLYN